MLWLWSPWSFWCTPEQKPVFATTSPESTTVQKTEDSGHLVTSVASRSSLSPGLSGRTGSSRQESLSQAPPTKKQSHETVEGLKCATSLTDAGHLKIGGAVSATAMRTLKAVHALSTEVPGKQPASSPPSHWKPVEAGHIKPCKIARQPTGAVHTQGLHCQPSFLTPQTAPKLSVVKAPKSSTRAGEGCSKMSVSDCGVDCCGHVRGGTPRRRIEEKRALFKQILKEQMAAEAESSPSPPRRLKSAPGMPQRVGQPPLGSGQPPLGSGQPAGRPACSPEQAYWNRAGSFFLRLPDSPQSIWVKEFWQGQQSLICAA